MLNLFNTLNRKKEEFIPLFAYTKLHHYKREKVVGLYTCGPTVYNYAHIGNLRSYIFEDILKRALLYNNYKVRHVMNITDVGHLTSNSDDGEDKIEKGAKREGKTAWKIAAFYTRKFKENLVVLNILPADILCKATDNIPEQIALAQKLIDLGYTYETNDGIYFDTTKITDYGKLAGLKKQKIRPGARVKMSEKKNQHDFALWKWSKQNEQEHKQPLLGNGVEGSKRQMEWKTPFGNGNLGRKGFPGWHLECSAISMKFLGEQFDIHCGGIDHISIHHTNEIAQSEAATGKKPWVRYWMHNEFLLVDGGKMAKSKENFITLDTLIKKGFNPLSYRYFLLQTHYRKKIKFTWKALEAAEAGLKHLYASVAALKPSKIGCIDAACRPARRQNRQSDFEKKFLEALNDDLNIPKALAVAWDLLKSDNPSSAKAESLLKFDQILGLNLAKKLKEARQEIPTEIKKLSAQREKARQEKNWVESDSLREEIIKMGFAIEDTNEGQKIIKKK